MFVGKVKQQSKENLKEGMEQQGNKKKSEMESHSSIFCGGERGL